jgi:hypothetical protein
MENVLFFYNPWWTKRAVPAYMLKEFKRDIFYKLKDHLKLNRILVLKGPRRVGKTTVLYQIINSLLEEKIKPENILYLSLDDPKLKIDFDKIIDSYQTKILKRSIEDSSTIYIFLDEVQYLENWQYYVKKYFDRNYPIKFVVSGSSATLIQRGTESLMGRTVEETLLPFSFKEFLEYHTREKYRLKSLDKVDTISIKKFESEAKIFFEKYLLKGGFPNIFEIEEIEVWQKLVKEDIIDKAVYRDLVNLYDIKKPELLEKLLLYVSGITGQTLNISNISNSIGLSRGYVNKYLRYLKNTLLLVTLKKYAKSIEKIIRSNEKAYVLDQGIINSLLNKTKIDDVFAGHLVETVVLRHLLKYEIYYWKNYYEVDFIVIKDKITPIEVKYKDNIDKKDIRGIISFCKKFKVKKGIIITKDLLKKEKINGKTIYFVPAWLFLLTEFYAII